MTHPKLGLFRPVRWCLAGACLVALTACEDFDFDLRDNAGAFSTAQAAQNATDRPRPDERGIITFPTYQVAIARRGDTVQDVASRIGYNAARLGSFNGLPLDTPLREGELIALPEPLANAGTGVGTGQVDVTALAGQAIENAQETPPDSAAQTGNEPIRHKVARGETAFSIARLYGVSVRSLARWNSLGPQFAVREGQFLLIPVAGGTPPAAAATVETTTIPGEGSPTPTPPSAAAPLPDDPTPAAATAPPPPKPQADVGPQTKPVNAGARFALPVQGKIIRDYAKGRNEGLDIQGPAGGAVKAAGNGTVAAITESSEGVPIIVVRHDGNLLTVYANVTDVLVQKGDSVRRGQGLAKLRSGDQSFVHFEVREGFDSVDPNIYLN